MGVARGQLTETLYGVEDENGTIHCEASHPVAPGSCCPNLREMRTASVPAGQVAYASDKIGLHKVSTIKGGADSVSLHLYSPPILVAKIYDPETNQVFAKRMCGMASCMDKINGTPSTLPTAPRCVDKA